MDDLEELAETLMVRSWRLANWNDHNFTYEDLSRWTREVQETCREMENLLSSIRKARALAQ